MSRDNALGDALLTCIGRVEGAKAARAGTQRPRWRRRRRRPWGTLASCSSVCPQS